MRNRIVRSPQLNRLSALGLAALVWAESAVAVTSDDPPFPFEITSFHPRYHDDPAHWLGDLGLFGIDGANAQAFTPGTIGLDAAWYDNRLPSAIRLRGQAGGWNVDLLGLQGRSDGGAEVRNSLVARITRQIHKFARLGFIATEGDAETGDKARTFGVDVDYQFFDALEGTAWLQQSDNPRETDGSTTAWGLTVRYPDTVHETELRVAHYGAAFDPALGQTNYRGADEFRFHYRLSPGLATSSKWQFSHRVTAQGTRALVTDEASQRLNLSFLEAENASGDRLEMFASSHRELLVDGFELEGRLPVAPGEYRYTRYGVNASTTRVAQWLLGFQATQGEYLNGNRSDIQLRSEWQPADWLRVDARYEINQHRQPVGAFRARTLSLKSEMTLLPGWTVAPRVQFDNVNEQLGMGARVSWSQPAGRELFLEWNRTLIRSLEDRLAPALQDTMIRGRYRFRF